MRVKLTEADAAELIDCLVQCAEDLAAELDARHQNREQYPGIMRRYHHDMLPVEWARTLLTRIAPPD